MTGACMAGLGMFDDMVTVVLTIDAVLVALLAGGTVGYWLRRGS